LELQQEYKKIIEAFGTTQRKMRTSHAHAPKKARRAKQQTHTGSTDLAGESGMIAALAKVPISVAIYSA
jgi:hypothetical protein